MFFKKNTNNGSARLNLRRAESAKRQSLTGFVQMTKLGGFTVIELLIVSSIIVILSSVVVLNHREADAQLKLERSANKLAQDIRRASAMAVSSQEEDLNDCAGTGSVSGFGVNLKLSPNYSYKLYGDCGVGGGGDNKKYNPSDWLIEEIFFEKGIIIESIIPTGNISINFTPPVPMVDFKIGNEGNDDGDGDPLLNAEIRTTLQSERYPLKEKTVIINKAGLVSVE